MHQIVQMQQQIQRLRDEASSISQLCNQLQQQQLQRLTFLAGQMQQDLNSLSSMAQQISSTIQTQGQFGQTAGGYAAQYGVGQTGFGGYTQGYHPFTGQYGQAGEQFGTTRFGATETAGYNITQQYATQPTGAGNVSGYATHGTAGQFGGYQTGQQHGMAGQYGGFQQSGLQGGGFQGSIYEQGNYQPNYTGVLPNN
ncbi:hypothetical protein [Desulfofundulus thermosubterraneus]|uniref:Uncharacterized protein n=1 Tax=Desulfofundulus thermosubterraneus DSM 16057 TaxID=1121432 RepID=A0A1M6L410_9FIRM|nr:hypothetical protein [Desulfofundulus thermosubterraneus]SHJ65903.1 hypothetical protein SAMN02745219_03043 [Desulfofundulus thermosubterraneus DSM 16057]